MWLVLCNPDDKSALWAGHGLRARGVTPVEFVSPVELICARRLEYRGGNGEPAHASAELANSRQLDTRQLRGTLNRATRIDFPQVRRAAPSDRPYIQAEMDAILLAWLGALPEPLFNPPNPSGWSGPQLHPFEWALRAQAAGFSTLPHRCGYAGLEMPAIPHGSCLSSHLVFDGRIFPSLPQEMELAAQRLATSAMIPLLGITLAMMPDGQTLFIAATPTPDLRIGGAAFLDSLTSALTAP
jgi:hypothetical protein